MTPTLKPTLAPTVKVTVTPTLKPTVATIRPTLKPTNPTIQPSDIELKHDVVRLGSLADGIGLYRFQYNWSDQVYVGVIAQEVAAVRPDAVLRGDDGYLRVDYARLGLRFQTWDEWLAAGGQPNEPLTRRSCRIEWSSGRQLMKTERAAERPPASVWAPG